MKVRVRVWDVPVRVFHGALIVLIAAQWASGEFGWLSMEWHFRLGYTLLALLLARIVWGFVGSDSARFAQFVRGPRSVVAYARAFAARRAEPSAGHNPLAGWSVLAMLLCVLVQIASGLCAGNPDIFLYGPLAHRFDEATVAWAMRVHQVNGVVLLVLIAVHLFGVLLHVLRHRERMIRPMIDGWKSLPRDPGLRMVGAGWALLMLAVCAAAVWMLLRWA
jgi:cytochrome b